MKKLLVAAAAIVAALLAQAPAEAARTRSKQAFVATAGDADARYAERACAHCTIRAWPRPQPTHDRRSEHSRHLVDANILKSTACGVA